MGNIGKGFVFVCAGFAAGIAFVIACGSTSGGAMDFGPSNAAAQAACGQYDVQIISTSARSGIIDTLPAGWIPFALSSATANVAAFRCTP